MEKVVYKLYANCIPVKGAKRSIICDLQRHSFLHIPNDLYIILTKHKDKSIDEIKSFYNNEYDETIDQYFYVLENNDLIFKTDTPNLFPDLNLKWSEPFELTNAIIDYSDKSDYNLNEVLKELSEIHCKFVQIRFYSIIPIKKVCELLKYLNQIRSNSLGIDIILPYENQVSHEKYLKLFSRFIRLNSLVVHSSQNENYSEKISKSYNSPQKLDSNLN